MRIAAEHFLHGGPRSSRPVQRALDEVRQAIDEVKWPPGADNFTVHPESGKKRGEGNGVVPIKDAFILNLSGLGWTAGRTFPVETPEGQSRFGAIDASKDFGNATVAVEWETGNISSSHRSVNKLCVGLIRRVLRGGILIVPSRRLAPFLTDRIGNITELLPYFELWKSVDAGNGVLAIIEVEQDAESEQVPRIRKGTDGRALT